MRNILLNRKSGLTRIEAPGCTISIDPGLSDSDRRPVCSISIAVDGNRYPGEPEWWIDGVRGDDGRGLRIVQTPQTYAPLPAPSDPLTPPECSVLADFLDELVSWVGDTGCDAVGGIWEEARRLRFVLRGVPPSSVSA